MKLGCRYKSMCLLMSKTRSLFSFLFREPFYMVYAGRHFRVVRSFGFIRFVQVPSFTFTYATCFVFILKDDATMSFGKRVSQLRVLNELAAIRLS